MDGAGPAAVSEAWLHLADAYCAASRAVRPALPGKARESRGAARDAVRLRIPSSRPS